MRVASFTRNGTASWGAVVGDAVVDLGARMPAAPTLRAALERGVLAAAEAIVADVPGGDIPLAGISFDPVIPDPSQILCVGLNYEDHRNEMRRERSGHPTIFARYAASQTGHGAAVARPVESTMLDFEGELAVVIGKRGRRVGEADALSLVAGYSCYNDISVRDFQRHTSQFHAGKNFPGTGAFGPWMVTADDIPDYRDLTIQTRLNGNVVQSAVLDQLIFDIPALIAYCSIFTELRPGDVIVTGTPGGVGSGRTPPLWMKAGDTVEVDISAIGILTNTIVDETDGSAARTDSPAEARLATAGSR